MESAAKELGLVVKRNAFARGWGSDRKKCDMVLEIPGGRYDIAVTKNGDRYVMDGDYWDQSIERHLGKSMDGEKHRLGKLLEMYSVHKAEGICKKKRKKFKRKVYEDRIDIVVTV